MSPLIHWHEGLFLQPHHLQLLQRACQQQMQTQRLLSWQYPYGLIEARLFPDELEAGRIRFETLRLVLRSGLEVRVPENAELPPLDLKPDLAKSGGAFNIYLGVPLWSKTRPNVLPDRDADNYQAKILYRLREIECPDENTGNNPRPVPLRVLNARLLREDDDRSELEVLPLLRIKRALEKEGDVPQPDPQFVPPCLILRASPTLRRLVMELASKIEATQNELAPMLARGGMGLETKLALTLGLQSLGRGAGLMRSLVEAPATSPFDAYLELRQLLGELAALQPERQLFGALPYDHDNLLPCFHDLDAKIRELLPRSKGAYAKVLFQEAPGFGLQAELEEELLKSATGFYLGIKTRADRTSLAAYVCNGSKFKFMPKSLSGAAVFGVELKEENFPPHELPAEPGLHYFRLNEKANPRRWQTLVNDKVALLEWNKSEFDFADSVFALYLTLPS